MMYTPVNPSFTVQKWGLRGAKLYRHVFVMPDGLTLFQLSLTVHRQVHKLSTDGSQTVHGQTDKSIIGHSSKVDITVCRLFCESFY